MILTTKTLVIFHFCQPSWQSKSNQTKAIKLPQHWWSDRSEATLISKLTSLTSTHVRLVAVPSNSGIRKKQSNIYSVVTLIAQDLVSAPSSQAFVERLFSVCVMLTLGRRNRMDKSLNTRAWLKVNHDSLVDMGMWTHWTVLQLLYAVMHSDGRAS